MNSFKLGDRVIATGTYSILGLIGTIVEIDKHRRFYHILFDNTNQNIGVVYKSNIKYYSNNKYLLEDIINDI